MQVGCLNYFYKFFKIFLCVPVEKNFRGICIVEKMACNCSSPLKFKWQTIACDNAGQHISQDTKNSLSDCSIVNRFFVRHKSHQNSVPEVFTRTIYDPAHSMLHHRRFSERTPKCLLL